jgi:threonine dehydratase
VTGDSRPAIADVEAAARRIASFVWHTPLIRSPWLSAITGAKVWLKLEIVQTTGSYKMRGAGNALARLTEQRPDCDAVVTASAGNHGLAVAWAAKQLGLRARVHVPATAPAVKRDTLAALGATVLEAPTYDEAETRGREDAEARGTTFVSPYSHSDVIAGAGTVALEMLMDEPSLDTIVAPLGGGGLLSGAAIVARAMRKDALVVGAEAEASPVFTTALAAGHVVDVRVEPTLADGLAGNMDHTSQTFGLVRDLVDHVVLVAESSIALAMRDLIRRERVIAEGAGATGAAALLQRGLDLKGRHVGVILSGRNVDAGVIARILGAG